MDKNTQNSIIVVLIAIFGVVLIASPIILEFFLGIMSLALGVFLIAGAILYLTPIGWCILLIRFLIGRKTECCCCASRQKIADEGNQA